MMRKAAGFLAGAMAVAALSLTAVPGASAEMAINGAGATFPYPLYSKWFYEYSNANPGVKFNYQSIGSGGGIKQITAGTVDFGASDAPMTEEEMGKLPGPILHLPTAIGAVAVVYNIPGVDSGRKLTQDVLAEIFLGKITRWNDPKIFDLNKDRKLPNADIVVAHRSDGSGTTDIFTNYLSAVNAEWRAKVGRGKSVKWPVGLGGKGNEGVAGVVKQTPGAVGYVELAYAKHVEATVASTQVAVSDYGSTMPESLAASIVNAPGKDAWPIAGYTYLIIYMDQQDCTSGKAVVDFVKWAVADNASKIATELDYVPLSSNVRTLVLNKLSQVTCQGKPLQ